MAITLLNMLRKLVNFWRRFHFFAGWIWMISVNIMFSQKYPMDSGQQFKFFMHCFSCVIQTKPSTVNVEFCSVFDHEDITIMLHSCIFYEAHFSAIWQIFKLEASFTAWTVKNSILFLNIHDLYNDLTHPLFFTCHFYDKQIALFYDVTMEKFFLVLTQNYWSVSRTWQ